MDVVLPIDFHSIIFQDGKVAPPTSVSQRFAAFRMITNGILHQIKPY